MKTEEGLDKVHPTWWKLSMTDTAAMLKWRRKKKGKSLSISWTVRGGKVEFVCHYHSTHLLNYTLRSVHVLWTVFSKQYFINSIYFLQKS